jgi:predicted metal-binding membrane protein
MQGAMSDTAAAPSSAIPGTGLYRLVGRPAFVGVASVAVLAVLGWGYVGLMLARGGGFNELGAWMQVLCQPAFGKSASSSAVNAALVLLMWGAMVLAMMTPTAGPMVLTYAEIAETAAAKGDKVVSPAILLAGYAAVWVAFAFAASAVQLGLTRLAALEPSIADASGLFAGAAFIGAGAYQFSALKHACLTRCQRPFPFLFANWTDARRGIFRLGAVQGIDCLGCCWAMMLTMFAVGAMNVAWMATLGAVMAAEKLASTPRLSRAVGLVLLAVGAVLVVWSVAIHWPKG